MVVVGWAGGTFKVSCAFFNGPLHCRVLRSGQAFLFTDVSFPIGITSFHIVAMQKHGFDGYSVR
jgi:hypothetical protein